MTELPSFRPLPDPAGLAAPDRVYAELRARILAFDLPPGTTLSRADLAEAHGVSQSPIREALQRLRDEGLVLIYPQSRTVVSRIDMRQLFETQFLRVAVETEVVRRLAGDQTALRQAQTLVDMQKALVEAPDALPMFTELDRSFHQHLFQSVGMGGLFAMVQARLGHLARCQRLELPLKGKMQTILRDHQAILDALGAGQPDQAAEAMRTHLSGTISRVEALRAEHPDYFTQG